MQFYRMQWQANPANLNFMGSFESSRDRHDGDVVFLAEVFCHLGDARSGLVANLLGALKAVTAHPWCCGLRPDRRIGMSAGCREFRARPLWVIPGLEAQRAQKEKQHRQECFHAEWPV